MECSTYRTTLLLCHPSRSRPEGNVRRRTRAMVSRRTFCSFSVDRRLLFKSSISLMCSSRTTTSRSAICASRPKGWFATTWHAWFLRYSTGFYLPICARHGETGATESMQGPPNFCGELCHALSPACISSPPCRQPLQSSPTMPTGAADNTSAVQTQTTATNRRAETLVAALRRKEPPASEAKANLHFEA